MEHRKPGFASNDDDLELFSRPSASKANSESKPSNFNSSNTNSSRGGTVNTRSDEKLAINVDVKKFFENPGANLGWIVLRIFCVAFFLAAITGRSVGIDSVWSLFNPAVWGSIPGSMAGNAVRNVDETVVRPINSSIQESQGRSLRINTDDGQLEEEVNE